MEHGLTGGELLSIITVIIAVLVLMYMVYQGNKKQEKETDEKIAKLYNWSEEKLKEIKDTYVTEKVCIQAHKNSDKQFELMRDTMDKGFDRISKEILEAKKGKLDG